MLETKSFSLDEYLEISRALELHASIFFKFWDMGKPVFSNQVPTSAVLLDKENNMLNFAVNPEFWDTISGYDKTFVIAHECMHVLLKHGTRGHSMADRMVANATMDIAINHLLVNNFGFSRALLSPGLEQKLCWVDTVFADHQSEIPPDNKAFEYYYELLRKMIEDQQQQQGGGGDSGKRQIQGAIDDLSSIEEIEKWLDDNKDALGATKEEIDELKENLEKQSKQQDSKNDGNDKSQQGRGDGNSIEWLSYPIEKPVIKNKWEKLFKEFNRISNADADREQWARPNRRFVTLPSDLMIPTENADTHFKKEKIEVYLFLDVSGSCRNLAPRFLKAARSISQKHFEIHACVFSTWVEEISLKAGKIPVGSGTRFSCMEDYLRKQKNYPKYVMVFTDGDGGYIFPKLPQNWHWFLSKNARYFIPPNSKVYMLKEFE